MNTTFPGARARRTALTIAAIGTAGAVLAGCASADPLAEGESSPAAEGDATTLVVGSQDYYSNEIIAELYAQALPHAHTVEVTEIDRDFEGDAFAPALGPQWQEVQRERHLNADGLPYSFVSYRA